MGSLPWRARFARVLGETSAYMAPFEDALGGPTIGQGCRDDVLWDIITPSRTPTPASNVGEKK